MNLALADCSKKTYGSVQCQFFTFCEENFFVNESGSPLPASELTVFRFIDHKSASCKSDTLHSYLSAIRHLHISSGYQIPLSGYQRVPLVLKYLKHTQGDSERLRTPITALVLFSIRAQLDLCAYNDLMFWVACLLAFFGFLRCAEFTVPSTGFDSELHLSPSDIKVDRKPFCSRVLVHLKTSKMDQFRRGYTLVLAKCNSVLCPATALMRYLDRRGHCHGPLFRLQDISPLTRVKSSEFIQETTKAVGWSGDFTTHSSFRIDAASQQQCSICRTT